MSSMQGVGQGHSNQDLPKMWSRLYGKAIDSAAPEATPAPVEKAVNTVTVEQVKAVAQAVKVLGGADRLNELLGLIREVGGLRRFKDLLDAMS